MFLLAWLTSTSPTSPTLWSLNQLYLQLRLTSKSLVLHNKVSTIELFIDWIESKNPPLTFPICSILSIRFIMHIPRINWECCWSRARVTLPTPYSRGHFECLIGQWTGLCAGESNQRRGRVTSTYYIPLQWSFNKQKHGQTKEPGFPPFEGLGARQTRK